MVRDFLTMSVGGKPMAMRMTVQRPECEEGEYVCHQDNGLQL